MSTGRACTSLPGRRPGPGIPSSWGGRLCSSRSRSTTTFKVDYELGDDTPAVEQTARASDELPKGNASLQEWQAYALAHGLTAEELEPLTRDQIRDHFSQPG